jgi:hypothetical protein
MLLFSFGVLAWAQAFSLVRAEQFPKGLAVRDFHQTPGGGTLRAIRRALSLIGRDVIFKNSTSFHSSFDGDVIFS